MVKRRKGFKIILKKKIKLKIKKKKFSLFSMKRAVIVENFKFTCLHHCEFIMTFAAVAIFVQPMLKLCSTDFIRFLIAPLVSSNSSSHSLKIIPMKFHEILFSAYHAVILPVFKHLIGCHGNDDHFGKKY